VEREKNPGDSEFKPQYGQKKKKKKRNLLEMLKLPLGNSDCF
jgi:hypothetical protein